MPSRDGGKNVDREKYYDNIGSTYWNANEQLDSCHLMRMDSFLSQVDEHINKSMDVFDFGCGTGETILPLIERGVEFKTKCNTNLKVLCCDENQIQAF